MYACNMTCFLIEFSLELFTPQAIKKRKENCQKEIITGTAISADQHDNGHPIKNLVSFNLNIQKHKHAYSSVHNVLYTTLHYFKSDLK